MLPNTWPITGIELANDSQWDTLGAAFRTGFSYLLKQTEMTGLDPLFFPFSSLLPILPREAIIWSPGRGKKEDRH